MKFKKNFFQICFVILSTLIGFGIFFYFYYSRKGILFALIGGVLGAVLGVLIIWVEERIKKLPFLQILGGTIGLLVGLGLAFFISSFFEVFTRGVWQIFLYVMSTLGLGYLGLVLGGKKFQEIKLSEFFERMFIKISSSITTVSKKFAKKETPKVIDTSAIIDGRVVNVCETGWLEGPVIVPKFVLEEIQLLSDSMDPVKRDKGKRALDLLNKLKEAVKKNFKISEHDYEKLSTDEKLIKVCKELGAKLVTTDYNLNKIARLQGVEVLNINELFIALKPNVKPGDVLKILIVKPGKEKHQGVGYLEDGTMVVVENARAFIGKELEVVVTHLLHSPSGRIIFTQIKNKRAS